LDLWGAEY